jgi:hypothetical protein
VIYDAGQEIEMLMTDGQLVCGVVERVVNTEHASMLCLKQLDGTLFYAYIIHMKGTKR